MSTWFKHLCERKVLYGLLFLTVLIAAASFFKLVPEKIKAFAEFYLYSAPIIITIVVFIIDAVDPKKYNREIEKITKKISTDIDDVQERLLDSVLSQLAEELELGESERVSIFFENKNKHHFNCVGRYSSNKRYNLKNTKKDYLKKKGIIGQVWDNESKYYHFKNDDQFPDVHKNPNEEENYLAYLKKEYNLYENITRNLRMRPVHMIAKLIEANGRKAGVIVFESTKKSMLDWKKIEPVFEKYQDLIVKILTDVVLPPIKNIID